jgi:hypothetical protein
LREPEFAAIVDAFLADALRLFQSGRTQHVRGHARQQALQARLGAEVDITIPARHLLQILDRQEIWKIVLANEAERSLWNML